jgi:hypothetical protein
MCLTIIIIIIIIIIITNIVTISIIIINKIPLSASDRTCALNALLISSGLLTDFSSLFNTCTYSLVNFLLDSNLTTSQIVLLVIVF